MSQIIALSGTFYHQLRGQIFLDFTPQDWKQVKTLEDDYEKKTAKARHRCRSWAIDTIVFNKIREDYDHGFQVFRGVQKRADAGN